MSRPEVTALDMDAEVWVRVQKRSKNREGKGLREPVFFIKSSLGEVIAWAILSKTETVTMPHNRIISSPTIFITEIRAQGFSHVGEQSLKHVARSSAHGMLLPHARPSTIAFPVQSL